MSLEGSLAHNCDEFSFEMASVLGASKILQTAQSLGLGKATGLPTDTWEAAGSLLFQETTQARPSSGARRMLANMAAGRSGVAATPVQMALVASFVANRGRVRSPTLTLDRLGELLPQKDLPKGGWERLQAAMKRAVEDGCARTAKSHEIQISALAGSTPWRLSDRQNVATLAGYAPRSQPQIAFAIVVEGKPDEKMAGYICGPIAKALVERRLSAHTWKENEITEEEMSAKVKLFLEQSRKSKREDLKKDNRLPLRTKPVDWTPSVSPHASHENFLQGASTRRA